MIGKNDKIELDIISVSSDGCGVGKYRGMAVFVPHTCVGDRISAHIVKVKKSYAFAKIDKIICASKHRIESRCGVSTLCGGCSFNHIDYPEEIRLKKEFVDSALARIGKLDLTVEKIYPAEKTEHYRNKAQYPVSEENGQIKIGFYAKRSHRVINCEKCRIQPEEFSEIVKLTAEFVKAYGISVYDEKTHKGLLRHIYLRKGFASGQLMVCLVINGNSLPYADKLVELLTSAYPGTVDIELNINTEDTNVVLGNKGVTLYGKGYIEDKILDRKFRISPLSFYQVNHDQTEVLYATVKDFAAVKGGETIIDLYCGIGTIGICTAEKSNRLIGVEVIPQAVENAKENARINNLDNVEFICASGKKATEILKARGIEADVVIVDPPRKGCEAETIENIIALSPKRVVYVSCNPASLARDLALFDEKGYKAEKVAAADLFPRTPHIECVVSMFRTGK